MIETGLFAGADITRQPAPAFVPMIVRADVICESSRFTDDKPSERCVWISFWVLYKEVSVRTAVPIIVRPGFSMSCEIVWNSHSGNAGAGAGPNETVGMCGRLCQQGSVGLRICADLRGFFTVQQQRTHTHKLTHRSSSVANTVWCYLHLSS